VDNNLTCPVCGLELPAAASHCERCGPPATRARIEGIQWYLDRHTAATEELRGAVWRHKDRQAATEPTTEPELPAVTAAAVEPGLVEPPRPPEPQPAPTVKEKAAATRSWAETFIRSLLYIGVFGLAVTLFAMIFQYRDAISGEWKFASVLATTLTAFGLGQTMRTRWDYDRTGLAFIMLAGLLLPMNWYAAKAFGLIGGGQSATEWGVVAFVCSAIYAGASRRIQDPGLPYLVMFGVMAALACFATAAVPRWTWRGVGAAFAATAGLTVLPTTSDRYRWPVLLVSGAYGALALLVYVWALSDLASPDGPGLWRVGMLGMAFTLTVQAADLRRPGTLLRYAVPLLLALNAGILVKELSTGASNAGFVIMGLAFLVLGQAHIWRRRGDETALASATACDDVSSGIGMLGLVVVLLSVLTHTLTLDFTPPVLSAGGPVTLTLGLVLGAAYAYLRARALPEWIFGACMMALAGAWYVAGTAAPGPDARALAVVAVGAVFALMPGEGERHRAIVDTGLAAFGLGALGLVTYRTVGPLAHGPAIIAAAAAFGLCFAIDLLRPTITERVPEGAITNAGVLAFGAAMLHAWAWATPAGWTWAVPAFLVAAGAALGGELVRTRSVDVGRRWYAAGFNAALLGLAVLGVDLATASVSALRGGTVDGMSYSSPVSVWTAFALAGAFYGLDAARRGAATAANIAAALLPAAAWYGALQVGVTWPTAAAAVVGTALALHLIATKLGELWQPAFRSVAGVTMAIAAPLGIPLLIIAEPSAPAAIPLTAMITAYFAERTYRDGERAMAVIAVATFYPVVWLSAYALGLVTWTPGSLVAFAGICSMVAFGALGLVRGWHQTVWYGATLDVTWVYGLTAAAWLVTERAVLPGTPTTLLAGGWILGAWSAVRGGHERAGIASLVAGVATWAALVAQVDHITSDHLLCLARPTRRLGHGPVALSTPA